MSSTPDLVFRRLESDEVELASALAASAHAPEDAQNESFGLASDGSSPQGETWGLFLRGTMAAALWVSPPNGDTLELTAAAIPRGRRHMGLLAWMAGELARAASLAGMGTLLIRIGEGEPGLGESLADAGFSGPDPDDDGYPRGEWRRPAFAVVDNSPGT